MELERRWRRTALCAAGLALAWVAVFAAGLAGLIAAETPVTP
ncbi:hypothetical protein [Amycolatopsis sp. NPDC051371]